MHTLNAEQCRIIAVLLEKEVVTPDQYPLSLNGLTNACNQKSNRDPVVNYSEQTVQQALDELSQLHLVNEQTGFGSRVIKYKHRFCNTEFGNLTVTDKQKAILCVLMLRGPQTPGELRTRTNRLAEFDSINDVETTLNQLTNHDDGQLVLKLEREPGKRDCRYTQQFYPWPDMATNVSIPSHASDEQLERLAELETQVAQLLERVSALEKRL